MITLHNQYIKLCANIYIYTNQNNNLFTDCIKSQPNTTKTCSNCKKQPLKLKNLYIFYRKINTKRKPKNKKSVFLYEKHTNTTIILPINTKKRWMPTYWHPSLWSHLGLNQGPPDYESGATNQLSYRTNLELRLQSYEIYLKLQSVLWYF